MLYNQELWYTIGSLEIEICEVIMKDVRLESRMRKFILNYLSKNIFVDAVDEVFHESFYQEFGGVRKETMWGAQPVRAAQRQLREMYNEGILDRGTISLGANWQPGLPKWVYAYSIRRRCPQEL